MPDGRCELRLFQTHKLHDAVDADTIAAALMMVPTSLPSRSPDINDFKYGDAREALASATTVVQDVNAHCWIGGGLKARSWGGSTPMKMCNQAVLDDADALRHMNKNNSERPVCITHPLAPISTSFLFVFDTEWVMSTRSIRAEISCCRLV